MPHIGNKKFAPIVRSIDKKLKADGYTTAPLGDGQALIIHGKKQEVV